MKFTGFICILAPFTLAVASTVARADDANVGSMLVAGTSDVAPADPAPASSGQCCDCCGPGTNPWDGTLKVGMGLRFSDDYVVQHNGPGAAFPTNTYNYFTPDDARIYCSGSAFHGLIKGTLNTEVTNIGTPAPGGAQQGAGTDVSPGNTTTVNLLDCIAQFEFNDKLNFWAGRFLPPTDRANLDGPFYQTPYDYPFVSNYPSLLAGRDDGAAYWGQAGGGKIKWQLGMFNGIGRNYDAANDAVGPNATGNYLYIGRLTVNLLDPEPGYYTQSCYFGEKEILAIGMTAAFQRDGTGTANSPADFSAESIDFLWEHRLGNCGVIDMEGAFYKYNYGVNSANAASDAAFAAAGGNNGGAVDNQGTSEYLQLSYMLPQNIGVCGVCGRLQPYARYQYYARDFRTLAGGGDPFEGTDIGVNYVISGYNARLTVAWGQRDMEDHSNLEFIRTGAQLQF